MSGSRPNLAEAYRPVRAARLAALIAPGLAPATAQALLDRPALRGRLLDWIDDATAGEVDPQDRGALAAFRAAPARLASRAGAVFHAPRVRALIMAAELSAFVDAHGHDAREAALTWPDLAPPDAPAVEGTLAAAVTRDGWACLLAWAAALPPGPSARLLLTWPEIGDIEPEPVHRRAGQGIVRMVAL